MTGQLAFDLPGRTGLARADFFPSPANAAALAAVSAPHLWPQGRMILIGPAGSGKTHLAHLWAAEQDATLIAGTGLALADLPRLAAGPVVVDDADGGGDEAALFHLHNLMAGRHPLLLTAQRPPRDWRLGLPDLLSRLQAMAITMIDAPDDALLSAVLVKLFADRQIAVPPSLIAYLIPRMDRSLHAAARDTGACGGISGKGCGAMTGCHPRVTKAVQHPES